MTDKKQPWWHKRDPSFWDKILHGGMNELSQLSLIQDALNDEGEPVNSGGAEGYLTDAESFLKEVRELNGKHVMRVVDEDYDPDSEDYVSGRNITLAFNRGFAYLRMNANGWTRLNYYIADLEMAKKMSSLSKKHLKPRAESRNIYVITFGAAGCELTDIGRAALPLIRENYTEEVLKSYDHIVNDLKSETPTGRIAILEGSPGTGKTFLVRGILNDAPDSTCVIVPAGMIAQLAGPNLISVLLEAKNYGGSDYPILLIIEDGDMAIIKRDAGNMDTITSLLNFGDGMLGGLMDLRVVITTNAQKIEIDDAIKRPGRLSGTISVSHLDGKHANEILERLVGKAHQKRGFNEKDRPTLAEAYQKARKLGWKPDPKAGYKASNDKEMSLVEPALD